MQNSYYCLFNKANNEINYIDKLLNHPPSIIKQFFLSVERRLSELSSNDKNFQRLYPYIPGSTNKSRLQPQVNIKKHDQKKDNSQQRKRQLI